MLSPDSPDECRKGILGLWLTQRLAGNGNADSARWCIYEFPGRERTESIVLCKNVDEGLHQSRRQLFAETNARHGCDCRRIEFRILGENLAALHRILIRPDRPGGPPLTIFLDHRAQRRRLVTDECTAPNQLSARLAHP